MVEQTRLDTAATLAEFLRCSPYAIRKWVRTADLPTIRAGRMVRFDRGAVLAWMMQRNEKRGVGK